MGPAVYILNGLIAAVCALLLLRGYWRTKQRLLLWSGICFLGLGLSNLLIFVDLVLLTDIDLYPARLILSAFALVLLLYGLIWEGE